MATIVDIFDKRRFWGEERHPFLQKIKLYGTFNYAVTALANCIIPLYFKLTQNKVKNKITCKHDEGKRIIVSITSFPARIPTLWKVIECIIRQTVKPDKIVLYLTESQVGDIEKLPSSLLKLRKRGLEIRL